MLAFGSSVGNRAGEELRQGDPILWQTKQRFMKLIFLDGSKTN
jgi:hypothetical protein